MSSSASRAATPFTAAGVAIAVIGGLTWVTGSWLLRGLGLIAIALGCYLVLVGVGLGRMRAELRRREAEAAIDAAVLAATEACEGEAGTACATCDTACALRH